MVLRNHLASNVAIGAGRVRLVRDVQHLVHFVRLSASSCASSGRRRSTRSIRYSALQSRRSCTWELERERRQDERVIREILGRLLCKDVAGEIAKFAGFLRHTQSATLAVQDGAGRRGVVASTLGQSRSPYVNGEKVVRFLVGISGA